MLDHSAVEREISRATRALAVWGVAVAWNRVPAALLAEVQEMWYILICLLDDAPPEYAERLHSLIDRCDALRETLAS